MFRSPSLLLVLSLSALPYAPAAAQNDQRHEAIIPSAEETRIAREVRHQLVTLPFFGVFDNLAFSVNGGTVTLMGSVVRPTLKSSAENVTKRVEGVTQVINKIKVLPVSPMDDRIRLGEYRAIYGDPTLGTRYGYRAIPPIHIIVENGHVTLEGVVANEFDKNLINVRANQVPNVFSVTNNLIVESQLPK